MKSKRLLVGLVLVTIALAAAWFLITGSGFWDAGGGGRVKQVPPGDQEVAWIAPATSSDAWERLVSALKMLEKDWQDLHGGPPLKLSLKNAFLKLSAGVPEVGLSFGDDSQTIWVRWYKISGENTAESWVEKLAARGKAPLAIVGGDTTDRADTLARALQETRQSWGGPAPLFLVTTATADTIPPVGDRSGLTPHEEWPLLMEVYPKRTFRYSHTNTRMVEAIFDFLEQNPHVWDSKAADLAQLAGMAGLGDGWGCVGTLASLGHFQPTFLYGVTWWDDGYSRDMVNTFLRHFEVDVLRFNLGETQRYTNDQVDYSVGGYHQVNAPEALVVGRVVSEASNKDKHHFILALPTGAQRVRRFVTNLCRQAPLESRRFVVVSGDSLSLNHVFRDRETAWNILDVPVPLVFFSHRLPTDAKAGFRWTGDDENPAARTSTADLLLNRDVMESLLLAAFDKGTLLEDADAVMGRLERSQWIKGRIGNPLVKDLGGIPLFTEEGNRRPGTGEHIVWVQPLLEKDRARTLQRAYISVWGTSAKDTHRWLIRPTISLPVTVSYNQLSPFIVHRDLETWVRCSSAHVEAPFNPHEVPDHDGN